MAPAAKTAAKAPETLSKRLVQTGRIAYVAFGRDAGKLCTIVEIIDHKRALVDGPNVTRQPIRYKALHLTKFVIRKLPRGASTRAVKKLWAAAKIDEQWATTSWAKRLEAKKKRASLNDFERFKLAKAKQVRNRIVKIEFNKLKKQSTKTGGAKKAPAKTAVPPKAAAGGAKKK